MGGTTSENLYGFFQYTVGTSDKRHTIKLRKIDLLWRDNIDSPMTSWGKWLDEKTN